MKKLIALLLALTCVLALAGCGGSGESAGVAKDPASGGDQTAMENNQNAESGEAAESTEGKYPWEMEFREEDYFPLKVTAPGGEKVTSYRSGGIFGVEARYYCEYPNGDIVDDYYYPSGNCSHSYFYGADGSFSERHHLDDGYTDLEKQVTYTGTTVYIKDIKADGQEYEGFFDENGNMVHSISKDADGNYSEQEYYDNGSLKYNKVISPEYTMEERYDEENFHTYFYSKDASYEVELIADETGKLIKYTENGTVYENEKIPDWAAGSYNFRG